jgi:hypothetical protein
MRNEKPVENSGEIRLFDRKTFESSEQCIENGAVTYTWAGSVEQCAELDRDATVA